jgi:hypothetical protein
VEKMEKIRGVLLTFLLMLVCNACLQQHEPSFKDREIDTLLSNGGTEGTWQLTAYSVNGETQALSDCRLNHQLFFSRSPILFEKRDISPTCPLSGGLLGQGEWSVLQEEDFSNPILELIYEDGLVEEFRIYDITPLSFRLSRRVISAETEFREEYTYLKIEPEPSVED